MTVGNVAPSDVPLHRLLKRREADALLADFAALLPGDELALLSPDGRLFAGTGGWNQTELQGLLTKVTDEETIETRDLFLQPLLVNSRLVGALVTRSEPPASARMAARVLTCLGSSLTLLLQQAFTKREIAGETLDRYREINLLYRVGETIGACLDPDEIPQQVLDQVRTVVSADIGLVLLPAVSEAGHSDQPQIKASFGANGYPELLHRISTPVVCQVVTTGRAAIVTPSHESETPGVTEPIGAILCAPLKAQTHVLGVLLLGRSAGQPEFVAGDEKLVMALTGQAAIAIETARLHKEEIKQQRLEEELAIARQIQLSLLPECCPVLPGWEFAALYRSARQVGGDLYDFIVSPGDPHLLSLVVADVTGKGVPAALFMAFSRTILRAESANNRRPAAILQRANRFIVQDSRSRLFLSAFYATLDTLNGRLVYANGGHDWPLWLRAATGEIQALAAPGFLLGAFKDIKLQDNEIEIDPGDLLVFFTDGVTEARNENGELFGEEQLQKILAASADKSAQQLLDTIVNAVESFTGTTPQSDDFTLVVIKRQQ